MASSDDNKFLQGRGRIVRSKTSYEQKTPNHVAFHFEEIEGHVERHIGPVQFVYHDLASSDLPIDIMVVPATSDRRFHYLVTSGMSDVSMSLPSRITHQHRYRYAELVMALPKYWPVADEQAMTSKRWGYPVEHLKFLASVPHRFESWLSIGHSIPNGEPVETLGPDCDMTGFVLDHPVIGGESFCKLQTRKRKIINFYAVYPTYGVEMEHKLKKGYASLRKNFAQNNVMELFEPKRSPVISNTTWPRLFKALK
ncbi:MAG: suppressor of fused domain protein [Pseudomonadota bacterium]